MSVKGKSNIHMQKTGSVNFLCCLEILPASDVER